MLPSMAYVSVPPAASCLQDTSSTEGVTGTHDFVVANFSQLDGHIGVGGHVISAPFTVGGYDWTLKFYPDGNTTAHRQEGTSVFLHIFDAASRPVRGVIASYTLRLLENDGNESFVGRQDMATKIYGTTPPSNGHGFTCYFLKHLLASTQCINNGCLTIRCVLTVFTPLTAVPPVELPGHLQRALKHGIGTDVTFRVGGRAFSAHRFMLAAQSPVFNAQLFGPMMEKDMQCIEIVDMEPAIFEMLLHFIYTDSLPGDGEASDVAAMQHLLVAADLYGLDRLKLMCEENLCKTVDQKTVTATLALADLHCCNRLKAVCLEFGVKPRPKRKLAFLWNANC